LKDWEGVASYPPVCDASEKEKRTYKWGLSECKARTPERSMVVKDQAIYGHKGFLHRAERDKEIAIL